MPLRKSDPKELRFALMHQPGEQKPYVMVSPGFIEMSISWFEAKDGKPAHWAGGCRLCAHGFQEYPDGKKSCISGHEPGKEPVLVARFPEWRHYLKEEKELIARDAEDQEVFRLSVDDIIAIKKEIGEHDKRLKF